MIYAENENVDQVEQILKNGPQQKQSSAQIKILNMDTANTAREGAAATHSKQDFGSKIKAETGNFTEKFEQLKSRIIEKVRKKQSNFLINKFRV